MKIHLPPEYFAKLEEAGHAMIGGRWDEAYALMDEAEEMKPKPLLCIFCGKLATTTAAGVQIPGRWFPKINLCDRCYRRDHNKTQKKISARS